MQVGDLIRLNREKRGLTQAELARRLNVNRSYVHKLENGDRKISSDILISISKILEQPIEDFYPEENKRRINHNNDNVLILGNEKYKLDDYSEEELLEFIRLSKNKLNKNPK